ncbi:MAG: hypothetical protein WCI87_09910 [Euryarchaeota archaeon]
MRVVSSAEGYIAVGEFNAIFAAMRYLCYHSVSAGMLKESLLTAENERLKAANERLQLKHSEEFNRLRAEVQRLKKENNKLKAENKELERKYQQILKQLEKHKKREANT